MARTPKRLRVAGNVKPGSIKRTGTHVQFVLVEQDQTLPVDYTGTEAPPDTFKDDSQALADGRFDRDGVFHAKQLQAKCASKYAPQQGANSGQWHAVVRACEEYDAGATACGYRLPTSKSGFCWYRASEVFSEAVSIGSRLSRDNAMGFSGPVDSCVDESQNFSRARD